LFKKSDAQYRVESGKNIVEALRKFNGSPKATVALTHEIMHPTVVAVFDGAKDGNEMGLKHANTIVNEYNKANPKSQVTLDEMMADNDAFKNGETTDKYRSVQEFIAESWEKYHYEGKQGFSKAFQDVLDQITEAFRKVYKSLSGKELTPELRKMFDDLLGKSDSDQTQSAKNEPTQQQPTGEGVAEQVSEPIQPDATKPKAEGSKESLPTSVEPISGTTTEAATPVLEQPTEKDAVEVFKKIGGKTKLKGQQRIEVESKIGKDAAELAEFINRNFTDIVNQLKNKRCE
jgi:hypothetical protein